MTLIKLFDDIEIDTDKTAEKIAKEIIKHNKYFINGDNYAVIWVWQKNKIMMPYYLQFDKNNPSAKLKKIIQCDFNHDKKWYQTKKDNDKTIWKK